MKILIVENEYISRRALLKMLRKLGYDSVATATNSASAIEQVQANTYDLVLLDIHLGDQQLDGIDLGHTINQLSPTTTLIFISSLKDKLTQQRSALVRHENYLVKPIREDKLLSVLTTISEARCNETEDQSGVGRRGLWIKSRLKGAHFFIAADDILFLQSNNKGIDINIQDKRYFAYRGLVKTIEEIECADIVQVHKSYAVNKKKVVAKVSGQLKMECGSCIPIGRKFAKMVKQWFEIF